MTVNDADGDSGDDDDSVWFVHFLIRAKSVWPPTTYAHSAAYPVDGQRRSKIRERKQGLLLSRSRRADEEVAHAPVSQSDQQTASQAVG